MQSITAIIVDDEREGIRTLEYMLDLYCPQVKLIGTYESSIAGLKAIKREQPQLLFLDINMPHINGLELLELLGGEHYNAIFVTAHDEFVVHALRLNALDYLKKPVDETELKAAVARVKPLSAVLPEQISNVLQLVQQLEIELHTPIAIKVGNKLKFVSLRDITYCKSDGNFTYVHTIDDQRIYSSMSIGQLEEI
ncbi:MAG: LytR/AlgR family response regulator transcription factor, partial [Saprospiraceae bacterium]